MFCPQCGSPNDDAHAFCRQCGASLRRGETTAPEPPVTTPPPAAPATGQATEYAGFWWRYLATFLDYFLISAVAGLIDFIHRTVIGIGWIMTGTDVSTASDVLGLFSLLTGILTGWFYEALMVSSSYQATLGKMAVGIVVTDMEGCRISFLRATGRYFGKTVSTLLLLIGYLIQPFTEKRQALHDMMAGCLVLRKVPR